MNAKRLTVVLLALAFALCGGCKKPETVLDAQPAPAMERGADLYAVTGLYTPEALIAQQVYNQIDAADPKRERYYKELTIEDIKDRLDMYDGFTVETEGFTVLLPSGAVADGECAFTIAFDALYPEFVGEAIESKDYRELLPALHTLARACGAEGHSFEGAPDALIATLFMRLLYEDAPVVQGYIEAPKAEYDALLKRYFLSPPEHLTGGDGTALTQGTYRIPATAVADYGLRLDDGVKDGDRLTLKGVLLYGAPGGESWGELGPVSVKLQKTAEGYAFTGFLYS